jgi:hypothetical protein|tara:strand:+ start:570 stop:770 length:201 start_codon:yes stop_codon:yes gene_type:complete
MQLKKDKNDKESEDYILKENKKTNFGIGFIITVLIILIIGVAISGFYFELWQLTGNILITVLKLVY